MKKIYLFALLALFCFTFTGCSNGCEQSDEQQSSLVDEMIPETIRCIEVSGFCNGGELEPWELNQEEIEELTEWISELSLIHKTYGEGEAPNEVWNGGTSYQFNINNGEKTFAWAYIDKAYIQYDNEWYEIVNESVPPLNLDD